MTTSARGTDVRELCEFALASLPHMQLPSGLFCWDREAGDYSLRGRSLRYSLMVLLGLQKARANGYELTIDVDSLEAALIGELDSPELAPGDYGLYLWADARGSGGRGEELAARLERSLAATGGLPARVGMELGWIVSGLSQHVAAGAEAARPQLAAALDQLLGPNRGPSGLFRHYGAESNRRRRFPNFATQIYSVLALAQAAAAGLDERALPAARAAADRLLALQLADGGWPWVYDVEKGGVVERYEVYSVHQHAMAPMGLFTLTEAGGEERYADAAVRGLAWIYGSNELNANMIDREEHLVYRSIRRRRPLSRLALYANTAGAFVGRARGGQGRLVELNKTDRPYSFGWILEGWCGRESLAAA